jgi:hypothetical protein
MREDDRLESVSTCSPSGTLHTAARPPPPLGGQVPRPLASNAQRRIKRAVPNCTRTHRRPAGIMRAAGRAVLGGSWTLPLRTPPTRNPPPPRGRRRAFLRIALFSRASTKGPVSMATTATLPPLTAPVKTRCLLAIPKKKALTPRPCFNLSQVRRPLVCAPLPRLLCPSHDPSRRQPQLACSRPPGSAMALSSAPLTWRCAGLAIAHCPYQHRDAVVRSDAPRGTSGHWLANRAVSRRMPSPWCARRARVQHAPLTPAPSNTRGEIAGCLTAREPRHSSAKLHPGLLADGLSI